MLPLDQDVIGGGVDAAATIVDELLPIISELVRLEVVFDWPPVVVGGCEKRLVRRLSVRMLSIRLLSV